MKVPEPSVRWILWDGRGLRGVSGESDDRLDRGAFRLAKTRERAIFLVNVHELESYSALCLSHKALVPVVICGWLLD